MRMRAPENLGGTRCLSPPGSAPVEGLEKTFEGYAKITQVKKTEMLMAIALIQNPPPQIMQKINNIYFDIFCYITTI